MFVIWTADTPVDRLDNLEKFARQMGFSCHRDTLGGREVTVLDGEGFATRAQLAAFPGVWDVVPLESEATPPLVRTRASRTVPVGSVVFGDGAPVMIAGPCSVEDEQSMLETARELKEAGTHMIRGGTFKPRTSPYSFQGLGREGLDILAKVSRETGLPVMTEILSPDDLEWAEAKVDMIWVGARNMQNFALLKELGKMQIPVMLKRGMASTIHEFLMAAEHILSGGNENVVLCERGVRSFEPLVRYSLDLGSLALLREMAHLPLVVDPSHACGNSRLVRAVSRGAIAVGVDGLMVEVHPEPAKALSDADQALGFDEYRSLLAEVSAVHAALADDARVR